MNLENFLISLNNTPDKIDFNGVIALIDSLYTFKPRQFTNGPIVNEAGQNSGSCKLFAFAALQKFDKTQTLHCFGQYYSDVLASPEKEDHQNIRNFMVTGWEGISFQEVALVPKNKS